jgi:hypothetical protein
MAAESKITTSTSSSPQSTVSTQKQQQTKMAPVILNLLKTYPVNLKENLKKICDALELSYDIKDTKSQLQFLIDDTVKNDTTLEHKIREIANEMIKSRKESKSDESILIPNPSHNLSRSPVAVISIPSPTRPPPVPLIIETTIDDLNSQDSL